MGAKTPAPRNPYALAGGRLRGTVPSLLKAWGVGTFNSSQSPALVQGRGTKHAPYP